MMSTKFYTDNGILVNIVSGGVSIPIDTRNREYRKIMIQDALTSFEREEIPEPELDTTPSLQEQINTLAFLMGV